MVLHTMYLSTANKKNRVSMTICVDVFGFHVHEKVIFDHARIERTMIPPVSVVRFQKTLTAYHTKMESKLNYLNSKLMSVTSDTVRFSPYRCPKNLVSPHFHGTLEICSMNGYQWDITCVHLSSSSHKY